MKKVLALFLSLVFLFSVVTPAQAVGSGNIDGGGGIVGGGTGSSYWNPGADGVRVSVVNASSHAVVGTPIDLTNVSLSSGLVHFGKVCKLSYNGGASLSAAVGGYSYIRPTQALPRIISSSSYRASIEAIRSYFTDEQVIRAIAGYVGINFNTLVGGSYKLVIEPIAYFAFNGLFYAMTATEAALYDQLLSGALHNQMGSLTRMNLPLAIFLEEGDLGYPAWTGATNARQSNSTIISSLGIGIVRFEEVPETPEIAAYDYEYRVDTDVITSVDISGGQSDPDDPVSVAFIIEGTTYNVGNVYYPDGDSQLAWVKWHTPSTPCTCVIRVVVSGGMAQSTIRARIVSLDGHDPPNPVADDRNDSFTRAAVPSNAQVTSATWGVWTPWWQEHWVWVPDWRKCWHSETNRETGETEWWYHWVDYGNWEDQGWWEFDYNSYYANLAASVSIQPDSLSPTATATTLKSGYGIQETVNANVLTNYSSAVTAAQNALTYFPEFRYQNFWRLLQPTVSGKRSSFSFKPNHYSTYNRRTHFTPIWYPNGSYTPYTWLLDCWTPTGMLSVNLTDTVTISGDLWEEWHIAPTN